MKRKELAEKLRDRISAFVGGVILLDFLEMTLTGLPCCANGSNGTRAK